MNSSHSRGKLLARAPKKCHTMTWTSSWRKRMLQYLRPLEPPRPRIRGKEHNDLGCCPVGIRVARFKRTAKRLAASRKTHGQFRVRGYADAAKVLARFADCLAGRRVIARFSVADVNAREATIRRFGAGHPHRQGKGGDEQNRFTQKVALGRKLIHLRYDTTI